MVNLIMLEKPSYEWLKQHTASIDDRRNALGFLHAESINEAGRLIEKTLDNKGLSVVSFSKRIGDYETFRIELLTESILAQEVKFLQKAHVSHFPIGLYVESLSQGQYAVWIYRTIGHKALTRFRKFLLSEVFYYKT